MGGFGGQKQAKNQSARIRISPGTAPALALPAPRKRPEQVWPLMSGGVQLTTEKPANSTGEGVCGPVPV